MSEASKSSACADGANIDLGASLLLTSKYTKIWRKSLYIGFLISLKKPTTSSGSHESPLSSVPYTSLPPSEPPARTSSAKSFVAIEIVSDAEEEKEEAVEHESSTDNGNLSINKTPFAIHGRSLSSFLLNSCKRNCYTILMLLISAGLSFATEFKQEGTRYGWHDGVAIVFAVFLLIAFSSIANFWRERQIVKLAKGKDKSEMQSAMSYNPEKIDLLEGLIEKPISYIDKSALFISVLVALVVFIRLICKKDADSGELPEIKGKVTIGLLMEALERIFWRPQGRISILTGFVTVAILCVQHGMPLMVTISLNYQIDKVEQNHDAVLNDLSACTTMGLVTVICIDVSGGLISMEVSRIWMGEKDISKVEGSEIDQTVLDLLKQGVSLSHMSNSLISWPEKTLEVNMQSFTEKFDILKQKFDKEGSGVLVREVGDNKQVLHLHWSGAASTILEMCSLYYDSKGERHAMENQKIKFGQVIKEMEDSGLKPIAFAYRQPNEGELKQDEGEIKQDELILLGLIGIKEESTKLDLDDLRNTGIKIKLVSEDDIMVVRDKACELGLEVPEDVLVLEGKELQDSNTSARLDKVGKALVMVSFSPEDKLLMVQCLKQKGDVVAFVGRRLMTSHPAILKVADVGIVHDPLSSTVDRESSSISIKSFSALMPIVRAGRSKYHNIQKFIQLQQTSIISGLLITLITTVTTGKSPLTAIQLIWVNVLMCLLGGLMMVMELNSAEELANPPSDRNQPIITKEIWKNIVIQVLYQASVSMILEFGGQVTGSEKEVRKTMIFNTFLLCQLFNQLNTMQMLKTEVLKVVLQSYCFLVALGFCFLVQVLVIEYLKGLANCMRLNATQWAICVLVGALSWVFELALKILLYILSTNSASEPNTFPFD
ncbi:putative calcium-transporting ATPase 13, plasma membrane-type isoform X2 [Gastrolobium bilobum]|uniref:putative calcium-transporting ATPase 13, plasma membrane-type isoform X2 n=1 Tax=Gastrolobium bilobum TaxID=150636 RepID=UPI002AB23308|nr:putative calcium-transporting ATPase 13, plasma membrane-type isoform X2 [Gastrolobium bilobum]